MPLRIHRSPTAVYRGYSGASFDPGPTPVGEFQWERGSHPAEMRSQAVPRLRSRECPLSGTIGEHILTKSFTARDPDQTFGSSVIYPSCTPNCSRKICCPFGVIVTARVPLMRRIHP